MLAMQFLHIGRKMPEMSDDDESHSRCTTVPTLHQKNIVLALSGPIFSQFKSVKGSTAWLHDQHRGLPGGAGRLLRSSDVEVLLGLLLRSSDALKVVVGEVAMCRL